MVGYYVRYGKWRATVSPLLRGVLPAQREEGLAPVRFRGTWAHGPHSVQP